MIACLKSHAHEIGARGSAAIQCDLDLIEAYNEEDTLMRPQTRTLTNNLTAIVALASLLLIGGAAVAEEGASVRSNATTQGQGIQRGTLGSSNVEFDEFDALSTVGERTKTLRSKTAQKVGKAPSAPNVDFWIYDVDLQIFSDFDRDGYFYGIDLLFDADTNFVSAEVYAVIYLSYEGGPWNEYADTENFNIFGASSDDEYVVVSELVSGYPTGDYDILIELFDTFDNSFVASIGPEDTSELSFVPLEDIGRDTPNNTTVVVSRGGGGSVGWIAILALTGLVLIARRRRA